ncbi:TM2 domain-containing protein [Bartonella sp. HY406]|uniref:TM2 domain-containing protein n=1 Tax=Bartonella sp. HY406 TaxID=2979331 RepID=UPI0021C83B0E|nr:TM2 domain-containing protein [Bartonella sp. HY406]UXN03938.1 TM2 domain-containing protein [Bartonella sp. HY406]
MRGIVISFSRNRGMISGDDGRRYGFSHLDWSGRGTPQAGTQVDFLDQGTNAKNIFPLKIERDYSKLILALICLFLGIFGVHRFAVGKIGTGILMLLSTCTGYGAAITLIWAVIDFIFIVTSNFTDKNGNKIE